MFDNNSKVLCYEYELNLTKPIEFVGRLIIRLSQVIAPGTELKGIFAEQFFKEELGIEFRVDSEGNQLIGEDELIAAIASYYNGSVIGKMKLDGTNVLLIHQPTKTLYLLNKTRASDFNKSIKEEIRKQIFKQNVLKDLSSKLINQSLRESLDESLNLQFIELFSKSIEILQQKAIDVPYLPLTSFDEELVAKEYIDPADLYINYTKLTAEFGITLTRQDSVYMLKGKAAEHEPVVIGIVYQDIVFPLTAAKLNPWIKETALTEFYWTQIKYVFSKEETRPKELKTDILDRFKGDIKKTALNRLLSYLSKNIYLPLGHLEEGSAYLQYFDNVQIIDKLKHLENFNFFISSENGKTALGIYSDKKAEEHQGGKIKVSSSYNLLHWGMNDNGKLKNYRDVTLPELKDFQHVLALKPEISFYYVSNYFEHLLEAAIQENDCEYIKNFRLFVEANCIGEIDFLIKSGNRLIIIEAKTKLNKKVIEEFEEKCHRLLKYFQFPNVEFEFYLIAAYSDKESCESQNYFINRTTKEDYNRPRNDLKTIPYYFKIPIPQFTGKDITCIAEPEFDRLKGLVQEICPK
jgi:hypothetical protein